MHNLLPLYRIVCTLYRIVEFPGLPFRRRSCVQSHFLTMLWTHVPALSLLNDRHLNSLSPSGWIVCTGLSHKYEGNTPLQCGVCPNHEVLRLRTSCQRDHKEGVKWLCWNRKLLIKFMRSVGVNWWSWTCKRHFERDCVKRLHSSKKTCPIWTQQSVTPTASAEPHQQWIMF